MGPISLEPAVAQSTPPTLRAIEIQGQTRIDERTIRGRLTIKVDDPVTPVAIRQQIRRVYELGFFEDVQVDTQPMMGGVVLVVTVQEKPFLSAIVFDGNKEISDEKLLKKISIRRQSFLDQQRVKESAEAIEAAYEEDAYYNAKVVPITQTIEGDRKRLTFFIHEGEPAKIETMTFDGAEVVKKGDLMAVMANRETVFFLSLFSQDGILKRDELPNDVERIRDVYMNRGYLNVQVSQPTLSLTEDKEGLALTFHLVEGEPFTFGEVTYRGNVVFEEDALRAETDIKTGDTFQRALIREEVERITNLYGARGYSFADVRPAVDTDSEAHTASVILRIEEGQLMRIRRIHISGNNKTRDNVIRRELRVEEQQVIDTAAMKRSFQRLNNLNFFETVEMLPTQVAPDKVDVEVKVKEKPTGSFSIGGGFSTLDQLSALGTITERNLFGKGYVVTIRGQVGQRRTRGIITLRDPSFRDSGTSLEVNGLSTNTDFRTYVQERSGGSLSVGRAFSEYVSGTIRLFGEEINIKDIELGARELILEQEGRQSSTGFRAVMARDTRDFYLDPRSGWRNSVGFDYATRLLGGSNHFYKLQLDSRKYTPLFWDVRHMIQGRFGIVEGLGGNPIPVPERFFVGGINTIRGFQFGRAGPVTSSNNPVGSSRSLIVNNDIIFPISPAAKLNGVVFFDYGIGYNSKSDINLLELKKTAGVEARWFSPFGPLRLAWGFNLDPKEGERETVFEFSVGSVF